MGHRKLKFRTWPFLLVLLIIAAARPLSQKLNTKIKAASLDNVRLDDNPYADWSAHLFAVNRTQYIILSNTKSFYSCVMYGAGITNDGAFIETALSTIREFMQDDGQQFVYRKFIAPASGSPKR